MVLHGLDGDGFKHDGSSDLSFLVATGRNVRLGPTKVLDLLQRGRCSNQAQGAEPFRTLLLHSPDFFCRGFIPNPQSELPSETPPNRSVSPTMRGMMRLVPRSAYLACFPLNATSTNISAGSWKMRYSYSLPIQWVATPNRFLFLFYTYIYIYIYVLYIPARNPWTPKTFSG